MARSYNKSPRPMPESITAFSGNVGGSAAWLKGYV
jgi:hypothetical protein